MLIEYILCVCIILISYVLVYRPIRKSHNLMNQNEERELPKLKWYEWWLK